MGQITFNMIKKLLLLFILIVSFSTFSQNREATELPETETPLTGVTIPFHSIYINKNNEIFFEEDKVGIHEIKEKIYGPYRNHRNYDPIRIYPSDVHLYADVNADYKIIDAVKTEIASTNQKKIFYRSNLEMNNYSEMYGIKYRLPLSYYRFIPPDYLYSEQERMERMEAAEENERLGMPDVPGPDSPLWVITSAEKIIYSIQDPVIREFFADKTVAFVNIGEDYFEYGSKKILFSEDKQIKEFFKDFDILIMNFQDGLKYKTYIHYLKTIISIEDSLFPLQIVEYSEKIKSIHKQAGIDIKDLIH